MNNKIQKYRDERDRNEAKMAAIKERNRELERKIAEEEGIEIRAVMRSENFNLDELIALLRSAKQNAQESEAHDGPRNEDDDLNTDDEMQEERRTYEEDDEMDEVADDDE